MNPTAPRRGPCTSPQETSDVPLPQRRIAPSSTLRLPSVHEGGHGDVRLRPFLPCFPDVSARKRIWHLEDEDLLSERCPRAQAPDDDRKYLCPARRRCDWRDVPLRTDEDERDARRGLRRADRSERE